MARGFGAAPVVGQRDGRSFNHRVFATIYRHGASTIPLVSRPAPEGPGGAIAPGVGGPVALVGASYQKSMGQASGTWSLTLKRGTLDIQKEIRAGDWVISHWTRNGEKLFGTMGMITGVRRRRNVSGTNASVETWVVNGRDFGRIFEITPVWFDDYTAFQTNVGGKIIGGRMGFNPSGAPDQIVQRLIDAFLGGDGIVGGAWRWPSGLDYLNEFFSQGLQVSVGGELPVPLAQKPIGLIGEQGKLRGLGANEIQLFQPQIGSMLHAIVNQWSNPILNEVYYDITDQLVGSIPEFPTPVVNIRERPFINVDDGIDSPWFSLPTVRITRDSERDDDIGVSDEERLNAFIVYATGSGLSNFDQFVAFAPTYSRAGVELHGLRKMEQSTVFADFGGKQGGPGWVDEMAIWKRLLASWYGPNHLWLAGTVTVPYALPEARIGKRLIVENDPQDVAREQFYIEGVSLAWTYPKHPTTTMTVTRGFRGSDSEMVDQVRDIVLDFEASPARRRGKDTFTNASALSLFRKDQVLT